MHKFIVKIKPFASSNKGGVAHNQLVQPDPAKQLMMDTMEQFTAFFNNMRNYHHKEKLPRTGNDAAQTQKWHIKEITKNNINRRNNINHLIYEADVLRHNNVVEDIVNQMDRAGNTDAVLISFIELYWILLEENKKFSAQNLFHKLYK